jgi:hypothetical protein
LSRMSPGFTCVVPTDRDGKVEVLTRLARFSKPGRSLYPTGPCISPSGISGWALPGERTFLWAYL